MQELLPTHVPVPSANQYPFADAKIENANLPSVAARETDAELMVTLPGEADADDAGNTTMPAARARKEIATSRNGANPGGTAIASLAWDKAGPLLDRGGHRTLAEPSVVQ